MARLAVITGALDDPSSGLAQLRIPESGNYYGMDKRLDIQPAANENALSVSGFSLTGSNAQSLFDLAGTWNTTGTPTGIKLNVTDTASNAASLLMNLQVGGASKLNVSKGGVVTIADSLSINPGNGATTFGQTFGIIMQTNNSFSIRHGNSDAFILRPVSGSGDTRFIFTSSTNVTLTGLIALNVGNVLEQRNGTNAQALRIYNTYTDASNYERGFARFNSNVFEIGTAASGTGTRRNLVLDGANRAAKINDPSGGAVTDAEARTAINAIIDALESHGLSAVS